MMNVTRVRVVEPVADLVRGAADGDEVARAEQLDGVLVGDPLAARRALEDLGDGSALRDAHATAAPVGLDEAQLRHGLEQPGVARELEERVEAGALARAEAVAELLEVAREEAGRIAVPLGRLVRELLGLGAREPHRGDERVLELREPLGERLRARPDGEHHRQTRPLEPEPCRDRGAASGPRTRSAARRRRSAASPPPRPMSYASSGACSASGSSTFVSATEVADSGVTATVDTRSSGTRDTSWIESTAPSDATHSRGSNRSVSAWRAYSIEEIGAVSSSPATSIRFSSVGTPCTSSTSGRRGRRPAPCSRTRCGRAGSPERLERRLRGGPVRVVADLLHDVVVDDRDLMQLRDLRGRVDMRVEQNDAVALGEHLRRVRRPLFRTCSSLAFTCSALRHSMPGRTPTQTTSGASSKSRRGSPSADLVVEAVALHRDAARLAHEAHELATFCSVPALAPAAWKIFSRTTVPWTSSAPKWSATWASGRPIMIQ